MFRWSWIARTHHPRKPAVRTTRGGVRIGFDRLDDRLAPSAGWSDWVDNVASAPATHFLVVTPESTSAGSSTPVEVIALDASNHLDRDYTGTVALTSTGAGDTLPANYTFTSSDRGIHIFSVTPAAAGSDTVTATDTTTASVTGSATVTVNAASTTTTDASTVTHFAVLTERQAYTGSAVKVEVVALNADDRIVPGYTGTVHFTSSDSAATLPADYTFTAADRGVHVFSATLNTAGSQTVTATDTTTASATGTSSAVSVTAAPVVTHFFVLGERQDYAGQQTQVAVVALDASNHVVPTYTGTVALTSTGTGDTLPAAYTFTSSDRGVHVFDVTPAAAGSDTFTATDTAAASVTGSVTETVSAAPTVAKIAVVAWPQAVAGQPQQIAVVAEDANGRIVPTYTGTVHFTSSDTAATLPADYTFTAADGGVHVFNVTFNTAGSQTVTATDTATASLTGSIKETVTSGSSFGQGGSPFGFGGHRWW